MLLTFTPPAVGSALIAGEPVTGPYFERFWLPVIGPTAFVLMRHLAGQVREGPYELKRSELARTIGVGEDQLDKTLDRLAAMRLLRVLGAVDGRRSWQVRLKVTQLDERQVRRLPRSLARQHRMLASAASA